MLATKKVRYLYSSMSFFYLFSTDRSTAESLYLLNDVFNFAKPRFLGLEMSEEDFKAKFGAYIKTEEFRNDMKKVEFLIATKKEDELMAFKGRRARDSRLQHPRPPHDVQLPDLPDQEVQPGLRRPLAGRPAEHTGGTPG